MFCFEWLFSNGIQCIDFPPYSPDLNPIENIWSILKQNVSKRQPKDKKSLIKVVKEEWKKIDNDLLKRIIDTMEQRLKQVIKQKGQKTKY